MGEEDAVDHTTLVVEDMEGVVVVVGEAVTSGVIPEMMMKISEVV